MRVISREFQRMIRWPIKVVIEGVFIAIHPLTEINIVKFLCWNSFEELTLWAVENRDN